MKNLFVAFVALFLVNGQTTLAQSVGGVNATIGEFDYFVDIYGCGATLIAHDIILTAAHCGDGGGVSGLANSQVSVSAYLTSTGEGNAKSRFCVEWINHPSYDPATEPKYDYDIALCKLDRPVEIDMTNAVVQLNKNESVSEAVAASGGTLTLLGTGNNTLTTLGKDYHEEFLKKVEVPVYSQTYCESIHLGGFNLNMMCGGSPDGDACGGDSGAPLLKREDQGNGTFVDSIVGMVSYGSEPCGTEGKPTVYNRIAPRWEWIEQAMCDDLQSSDSTVCSNATLFDDSCASDETQVVVGLQPDKFPAETLWELRDSDGLIVARRAIFVMRDFMSESFLCLKNGETFELTVSDTGNDGVADENNQFDPDNVVYYVAVDGTRVIEEAGDFSGSETVSFSIPTTPTQPPAPIDPPTASPTQSPVVVPEQCPADVMLVHQSGSTTLPEGAVQIMGRDDDLGTISVRVNHLFSETESIDDVYYQYATDFLHNDCYQEQNVGPGEHILFTIKCTEGTKIALAELWFADSLFGADSASIPNCCQSTSADGTPVAKYMFEFSCVSKC